MLIFSARKSKVTSQRLPKEGRWHSGSFSATPTHLAEVRALPGLRSVPLRYFYAPSHRSGVFLVLLHTSDKRILRRTQPHVHARTRHDVSVTHRSIGNDAGRTTETYEHEHTHLFVVQRRPLGRFLRQRGPERVQFGVFLCRMCRTRRQSVCKLATHAASRRHARSTQAASTQHQGGTHAASRRHARSIKATRTQHAGNMKGANEREMKGAPDGHPFSTSTPLSTAPLFI